MLFRSRVTIWVKPLQGYLWFSEFTHEQIHGIIVESKEAMLTMSKTIEERFIDHISTALPLFSKQSNAFRFQCPYCQSSGKDSKGRALSPSGAKGFLYPNGNAWNFKCHKCGEHQAFEKFLESLFPLLHFEYVRQRDQLGTTGFQTNCPSLETLLKKRGVLGNPPEIGRAHV